MSQNILTVTLSKRRTVKVLVILFVERISRMQMKLSNRFFLCLFFKGVFYLDIPLFTFQNEKQTGKRPLSGKLSAFFLSPVKVTSSNSTTTFFELYNEVQNKKHGLVAIYYHPELLE